MKPARAVIIFTIILLALAMVVPALADGPNGQGGKPDKSESNGQPAGGAQSGDANPGQAGQANKGKPVEILPENSKGKPGEQNQTRKQSAGQPEQPGQGKAKGVPG